MQLTGFGEEDVARKIKSIRTVYNQQKQKKKDLFKSGSGLDLVNAPNISWLNIMKRILEKSKPNNLQKSTIDSLAPTVEIEDDNVTIEGHSYELIEDEQTESQSTQEVPVGSRARKRKAANIDEMVRCLDSIVNRCQPSKPPKQDQLDSFGQYIITSMRCLERNVQLELQEKIQNLVMKAMKENM